MKTALITGGSSGIGYELSRKFAATGYQLLWVSNNDSEVAAAKQKLIGEFSSINIHSLLVDLSQAGSAKNVYDWSKQFGNVNVLVNSAGFGTYGYFNEIDEAPELKMLHLNMITVYQLTRYFLSDMISRNEGKIMNLSSNTALQPVPLMTTYAATKAFVKHFSQSLNQELKYIKSNVTITAVCPPATKGTGFQTTAKMENVKTFESILTATPEEVAKFAYEGMMAGEELVLAGKNLKNLNWLNKLLPTSLIKLILKHELQNIKSK